MGESVFRTLKKGGKINSNFEIGLGWEGACDINNLYFIFLCLLPGRGRIVREPRFAHCFFT